MQKIILIILFLITTSKVTFALEFPDDLTEENLQQVVMPQKTTTEDVMTNSLPPLDFLPGDTVTKDTLPLKVLPKDTMTEDILPQEALPQEKPTEEVIQQEALPNENLPQNTILDIVSEVNSLPSDEQKVKEWAKYSSAKNYVIINKKKCSAIVYDNDGNEIKSFEIGIGKEIGDDFNDTSGLKGKAKNTTPAGEYTLIPNIYNKSAYGDITLSFGDKANKTQNTKKVVALHKVPKFREKDRLKKFNDGNLANNRMSHGCINFLAKDFQEFTKYIHGGLKVYVLPEEPGNKLILTQNENNEFELSQTKY